jgi:hypothetical protein
MALLTPGLQASALDWERIRFCCFKPPSLWSLVTAATGDQYRACVSAKEPAIWAASLPWGISGVQYALKTLESLR